MNLLTVDTIEQARLKISEKIKSWPVKTKTIPLGQALGYTLAEDMISPCDIPSFRRSTVDGYAVTAADTCAAADSIPVFLKLAGSVQMGKPAGFSIRAGECAYVPTGGMLPGGADAVVMAEYCEQITENSAAVYESAAEGAGTVQEGEDIQKGKIFLKGGITLRPQEIGALAAAGITNIPVFSPASLSIISTGDELVPPDREPATGEIRDVNTYAVKSLAEKYGYNVLSAGFLPDDEQKLETAVREAAAASDIVIICGGSSKGEKDYTAAIVGRIAKPGVFTRGLAVKPGKPAILGWDEQSKTLFAGLPGHPVSAMIVFTLIFCQPPFRCSSNLSHPVPARISSNIPGSPGKTVCQPVSLSLKDGLYTAEPVFGKSGMITTLTRADGYIIIELNKEGLKKDESVMVYLF
ncbi:MAG: molybdopterin molybdotransferase MoeA [Treponema sp.]|nr:molybdopterin molybdotransferase MoeA [Treponema sp.]